MSREIIPETLLVVLLLPVLIPAVIFLLVANAVSKDW